MSDTPRILLVDDEQENLKALERTLRTQFTVTSTTSPQAALELVENEDFAVVVSDQRMPEMRGADFLAQVAKTKPLVTRIILTAFTETKEILDAINRAEIYRYITKPWDNRELVTTLMQAARHHYLLRQNEELIQELQKLNQNLEAEVERRTAELRDANEKLSELAMTDPLTKIANRRAFFQKFNEEIDRSRRYKHGIVVVMVDVDHFKTFNDMEGHLFGDEALKKIAQLFISNLRKTDLLGRYGGEEFVLMMPETKVQNALEKLDRLRSTIETTSFQGQKDAAYLTVSMGLASFPEDGETAEELIRIADLALYQAKEEGRNRVVHQGTSHESFFVSR